MRTPKIKAGSRRDVFGESPNEPDKSKMELHLSWTQARHLSNAIIPPSSDDPVLERLTAHILPRAQLEDHGWVETSNVRSHPWKKRFGHMALRSPVLIDDTERAKIITLTTVLISRLINYELHTPPCFHSG